MSTQWVVEGAGLRPRDGFQRFLRQGESASRSLMFRLQDEYRRASIRQGLTLAAAAVVLATELALGAITWVTTIGLTGAAAALAVYSMFPGLERRLASEQLAELDGSPAGEQWGPPSVVVGIILALGAVLLAILRLG